MPFQSVPETVELVIRGDIGGQTIANVIGFRKTGGYVQADLDALAILSDAQVGSDYLPLISSGVNYDSVLVRGLENIIDLSSTENTNAGPGTASGTGIPANNTFCVTLRSLYTGRSARGRFYAWPTIATNYSAPSVLSSTYGNAVVTFLNNLKTGAATAGWSMVIISRFSLGVKRPVGVTTNVTTIAYRNLIGDSQRHRLPRGH
jgi:hypothetical protein